MKIISTITFKHILKDVHKNTESRKFCFVVGSGASKSSGITTGSELATIWFADIKERMGKIAFQKWVKSCKINQHDLASSYGIIYRKRFEFDKASGYEFLVQAMKNAKPSLGHFVLAQILTRYSGHCVVTTNFDSLIESSIYQFTNKTPLVCGHESLSGYARPSNTHPLVIKIHRDLLLDPKSDPDEINTLAPGWKEPLDLIFSTHIPIIIGYGGNDGSLMNYFESMNKPSNFFWCGRDPKTISNRIKSLIEYHDGCFVATHGFDDLLYELLSVFDEIKPVNDELTSITKERIDSTTIKLEEIVNERQLRVTTIEEDTLANPEAVVELSAFEYSNIAKEEQVYEKRKQIYLEAISKYPTTGWLWWEFTYFLHVIKHDYENLEQYYQEAVRLNPKEAGVIGNYGSFLMNIREDYVKAEESFLKALSVNPNSVNPLSNMGVLVWEQKRDLDRAEEYFQKALKNDPKHGFTASVYAKFLANERKDYLRAEELFQQAIASSPEDLDHRTRYASFLKNHKKDNVAAEKLYLEILSKLPDDPDHLGNYALFLKRSKKDVDQAIAYYKKAIKAKPNHFNNNANYAQILLELGRKEEARPFVDTAFTTQQNTVLLELWFYRFAHFSEYFSTAPAEIESLLEKGTTSVGWSLDGNIKRAIKDKHPNIKLLRSFAKRICK